MYIGSHILLYKLVKNLCIIFHKNWLPGQLLLTGTFFCVTITAQSFPLTATDVRPPWLIALKAYSGKQNCVFKRWNKLLDSCNGIKVVIKKNELKLYDLTQNAVQDKQSQTNNDNNKS